MKSAGIIEYDNASQRLKPSAFIYNMGAKVSKERILETIEKKYSILHVEGRIHIHDLETYKYTYNCLQMDLLKGFPYKQISKYSNSRKLMEIFNHFRNLIIKLGHEQSGGIGFPNIDEEVSILFEKLNIPVSNENLKFLRDNIESFIDWLNESHERNAQYSFYVTFNLGLSITEVGRFMSKAIIEYFKDSSLSVTKPNIVFKVKQGVNYLPNDPNYDLFCLAIESTCKKMIPTYLLFDSSVNEMYDPKKVAIMGCRTKVVENLFGESSSIGRANIAYVSINLPRIALEIQRDYPSRNVDEKIDLFKKRWVETAVLVKDILLDKYHRLLNLKTSDFPCNNQFNLWVTDFMSAGSLEEIFKNGTLSVGFIGLSETIEVLSGKKYYSTQDNYARAIAIVKYMREVVDEFVEEYHLNFTLMATSGEYISGRFPEIDGKIFNHPIIEKKFYTNSFHVEVDSNIHPINKIQIEGPFHAYCNGGCISYVELSSAPINNTEAIREVIDTAIGHGVNYLGINFPLDECRGCGELGIFDNCSQCGGNDILRIRRVSGYLEDLNYFTAGKKAEEIQRKPNAYIKKSGLV
ncbi:MAG: anaerobic ribonucleoside-triphosphate reductase [Thermoplasmataceae archaeon]